MTCLAPVSGKLQGRATRILMSLAGVDQSRARELLARHDSDVAAALREAREPQLDR
jgi:N-acetylmuramic acid 6-phosphate (MurNAc-6-P) etherase